MKKLQIAVGIIRNPQGEIFITQRAADAHMANKLEFPGGKIESDETPEQALIRELQEKTGNPNGLGLPEWPSTNGKAVAPVLQIDVKTEVKSDAQMEKRYDFIDKMFWEKK